MRQIDRDILRKTIEQSGIDVKKVSKAIAAIEVNLTKQAAKSKDKTVVLDEDSLAELEETVRIGADLSTAKAGEVLKNVTNLLKGKNEQFVKLLDQGIVEIKGGKLKFKLVKE
jgi:hypothetical protein